MVPAGMVSNLDYGCSIVTGKASVFIHQRTLKKLDAFAFARRQGIETEALSRFFEDTRRDVDAGNFREGGVGKEQR